MTTSPIRCLSPDTQFEMDGIPTKPAASPVPPSPIPVHMQSTTQSCTDSVHPSQIVKRSQPPMKTPTASTPPLPIPSENLSDFE